MIRFSPKENKMNQAQTWMRGALALLLADFMLAGAAQGQNQKTSPVDVVNPDTSPVPVKTVNTVAVTGSVSINGSPTVTTLSGEQYYSETKAFGELEWEARFTPNTNVVLDSASVNCAVPQGQRVLVTLYTHISEDLPHTLPLQYQGTYGPSVFLAKDVYTALIPLKAFHKTLQPSGNVAIRVDLAASTTIGPSGIYSCRVTLDGTVRQ